ncbi:MAG TPA: tetratricopeptide repeat protein [Elainellaceae cyanobacterium]
MNSLSGHSKTFNRDSEVPEFLGLKLDSLRGLATFADVSEGFALAIAEVSFAADAEILIAALNQRPECQTIQFEVLDFSERQIISLLTELKQVLSTIEIAPDRKLVLVIRGLEKSIGAVIEYPPFLRDLNFVRDALARRIPHPIIFVLPKYATKRLARAARDFWAWTSAVFEFRSVRQSVETVQTETLNSSRLFSNDLKPVKQSRINQLHSLLEEYAPTDQDEDGANADIRLDILLELGNAYGSLADIERAQRCFLMAIELAKKGQHTRREADALLGLGKTLQIIETNTQALANYEQALQIYRDVGDRLGEANTLLELGRFLDDVNQSLEMYESAQNIYIQIGDRYSQARTLFMYISNALLTLGRVEEAIAALTNVTAISQSIGFESGRDAALQKIEEIQTQMMSDE